jgi:hypothetical protein
MGAAHSIRGMLERGTASSEASSGALFLGKSIVLRELMVGSMDLRCHAINERWTRKALSYDGALENLGFERRRDPQSNAQMIMSNARPTSAISSNTAIFASTGIPHSHEGRRP